MTAIINLPNQEEIVEDLNNSIFNCIVPKSEARHKWNELMERIDVTVLFVNFTNCLFTFYEDQ